MKPLRKVRRVLKSVLGYYARRVGVGMGQPAWGSADQNWAGLGDRSWGDRQVPTRQHSSKSCFKNTGPNCGSRAGEADVGTARLLEWKEALSGVGQKLYWCNQTH